MNKFTAGQQFSLSFNLFQMPTHCSLNFSLEKVKAIQLTHPCLRTTVLSAAKQWNTYRYLSFLACFVCHWRTGDGDMHSLRTQQNVREQLVVLTIWKKYSKISVITSCSRIPGACEVGLEPTPFKIFSLTFLFQKKGNGQNRHFLPICLSLEPITGHLLIFPASVSVSTILQMKQVTLMIHYSLECSNSFYQKS